MQQESVSAIENISAAVSAIAAVIAVLMAGWTVLESRRLREAQTSPEVIVYLDRNDRVRNVVDLVIRNIGAAPAYLTQFEVNDNQIPFGLMNQETIHILRNGINFFPPDQTFRFSLNTYTNLPKEVITVDVCYFAKGEIDHKPCRRQSFSLHPLELGDFAEWQDREREAHIATKKGMDEMRKTMFALRRGRISVGVRPDVRNETNEPPRLHPEDLAQIVDVIRPKELGGDEVPLENWSRDNERLPGHDAQRRTRCARADSVTSRSWAF